MRLSRIGAIPTLLADAKVSTATRSYASLRKLIEA